MEEQIVSERTRGEIPRVWLTATPVCHGEIPAQEVPGDVLVATVVVGGVVEVAGMLVVTGVVELAGVVVVVVVVMVVVVPPPDPPVSAPFTEISYLLLASAQLDPFYFDRVSDTSQETTNHGLVTCPTTSPHQTTYTGCSSA